MALMNLSYIVMHPRRHSLDVSAQVLGSSSVEAQRSNVRIFADAIAGNHDPCVLTDPWFYSYCHATQLRRSQMGPGSIVFFFDYAAAEFDTVFVVSKKHRWDSVGEPRGTALPIHSDLELKEATRAWELHFKWPSLGWHPHASITFEAAHWPARKYSFLPLSGKSAVAKSKVVSASISEKMSLRDRGKRPVPLEPEEAELLYKRIQSKADVQVTSRIQLRHDRDMKMIGIDPGVDSATGVHRLKRRSE